MTNIDIAVDREREAMQDKGVADISLVRSTDFGNDAVVIMYKTSLMLVSTIRRATADSHAKARYYRDTRIAVYVRGYRASSILVWRNYFDITDIPPHMAVAEHVSLTQIAQNYWGKS